MKTLAQMTNYEVVRHVQERVREFDRWAGSFRTEARDAFDFVAGRQWSSEDEAYLREQNRPHVTFNRVLKFVDAVVGTEINNKMAVSYVVGGVEDGPAVDLLSKVVRIASADDEEAETSAAFRESVTCGLGWTRHRMDYSEFVEGRIVEERVDPMAMGWDPRARKRNLSDARYVFEIRRYSDEELEDEFPDAVDKIEAGTPTLSTEKQPAELMDRGEYDFNDHLPEDDDTYMPRRRRVVCYQETCVIDRVMTVNPLTSSVETYDQDEFDKLQKDLEKRGIAVTSAKVKQKVVYQAMVCGSTLLTDVEELPCRTYEPITGKWDRNKAIFYGVVRVAKDPQQWANKFFSNIMHIMSSAGKGLILEESAIPANRMRDFERDFARPDKIKIVADGAIGQNRIMPPPQSPMPTGLPDMMQFATAAIPDTLGLSPEFLGLAQRTQSGVVERSRRQAGLAVLSEFFQARREHIKRTARIKLAFVLKYLPDSTFLRIGGPEAAQVLPMLRDADFAYCDVRVDEAPVSPDQKAEVWGDIIQMMPILTQMPIPPVLWLALFEYSPWPASLRKKFEDALSQPPPPEQQQAAQLEIAQKRADVAETQSKAQLNLAKAQAEGQPDAGKVVAGMVDMQKAKMDLQLRTAEHGMKLQEMDADTRYSTVKHMMEMQRMAAQMAQPRDTKVQNGD